MENKKRIIVVEPANGGGLIHFSYQMCNALAKAGVDVTLIAGTEYELDFLPHFFKVQKILKLWNSFENRSDSADIGIIRRSIIILLRNIRRVIRAVRIFSAWIRLTSFIIRSKPDWVLFSIMEYPFQSLFIRFLDLKGIKLSQLCHEFEKREKKTFISKFLHRLDVLAYDSFSKIFFLSDDSQKHFLGLFPSVDEETTVSIPHGNSGWLLDIQSPPEEVNLRERYGLSPQDSVVLFFGLLAPSKGIEDLIEAFSISLSSCKAKLVIAGYPTKYINASVLKSLANKLKLIDQIVLDLRYVPLNEIGALMELATVVVYPYRSSTQSGALQTAYTFGKPVIASKVGGLPEVVEDGKSGFLVTPRLPQELAEKISLLVNQPFLAEEMGKYAKHLSITRFNWEVVASEMLIAYNKDSH